MKYICPWTGKNLSHHKMEIPKQISNPVKQRNKKEKKNFEHNHPKSHSVAMVTEKKAKEKIKKTVN